MNRKSTTWKALTHLLTMLRQFAEVSKLMVKASCSKIKTDMGGEYTMTIGKYDSKKTPIYSELTKTFINNNLAWYCKLSKCKN
jgi:hypothetical protein